MYFAKFHYYTLPLQSPICRHELNESIENEINYEIEASILLSDKLYLIVFDQQQKMHVVQEVPLFDISILEQAIYLDNSKIMSMKEKWGFDPIESNKTIVTAFGIHGLQLANHPRPDKCIAFIYEHVNTPMGIFMFSSNYLCFLSRVAKYCI